MQQQAVRAWIAGGAGLSEVQKRLQAEFNLAMTYMDVRLLALELGAEVQDKPEPRQSAKAPAAPAEAEAPDGDGLDDGEDEVAQEVPAGGGGRATVTLDRVVQAGALASGTVAFSDGVQAKWMLDQMGRLALTAAGKPGYRPSQEDVRAFQLELQRKLGSQGY
jgi:hypothetical protein